MASVPPARPPLAELHDLAPHPEGGWYRRTWATAVPVALPDGRTRPAATSVLFALHAGETSAWHRVASDELWLWHGPGSVALELGGSGEAPHPGSTVAGRGEAGHGEAGRGEAGHGALATAVLGLVVAAGEVPQVLVPAGVWQRTLPGDHDALVSCVVSPGFDFADFTLAP